MSVVTVVATKDFSYQDRQIHSGQGVQMEAVDAAAAARRGEVSLDRQARATYQTRDMVAADPIVTGAVPPPAVIAPKTRHRPQPKKQPRQKKASSVQ